MRKREKAMGKVKKANPGRKQEHERKAREKRWKERTEERVDEREGTQKYDKEKWR